MANFNVEPRGQTIKAPALPVMMVLLASACAPLGGAAQSAPAVADPTATVRVAMQPTDPSTVVLTAGKPQLVEFFAFW